MRPKRTANSKRGIATLLGVALLALLSRVHAAGAGQKPLWEFGMGAGTLGFADYRGADTSHVYPVPVPYFVYRGKFLEANRNGVKGKLFDQERLQLNISLNATTPVRNNSARAGMPNLRPTVEIGPSLEVHVWRSADEHTKLDLRLPARGAFTIEASPRFIGWLYAPHLNLDVTNMRALPGWNLGLLAGPVFSSSRYDDYFYSVAPQFATATRPAYLAHGGYSGTQLLASLSKRYAAYWTGAFLRYDTLSGASFAGSPLVKSRRFWSAGVGVAFMIKQSSRLVEADE